MGAGKSTVGRCLADLLRLGFVDSDHEIEARTGADIPWIFDVEGESGFRDREVAVIADLARQQQLVIATGGGAILRAENRSLFRDAGTTVYLHANLREQVRRTGQDRKRPLLAGRDREQVLRELFSVRDPLYREAADIVIDTEGRNARRLAQTIQQTLRERGLLADTA